MENNQHPEEQPKLRPIDEIFIGIATDSLLRVYQSIFDSVKEISSHLRYSTSKNIDNLVILKFSFTIL